jgi:hypothetical protein
LAAALSCLAAALVACSDRQVVPGGWGPLRLATADTLCPDIAGDYQLETVARIASLVDEYESDALLLSLSAGMSGRVELSERAMTSLRIEGDVNRGVELTLVYAHDSMPPRDTVRLRRTLSYACEGGWLRLRTVTVPPRDVDAPRDDSNLTVRERVLSIAGGAKGSLVGRMTTTRMVEFPIWCGDGCKGIPLPWTATKRTTWMRLLNVADDPTSLDMSDPRERQLDDRLRQEERRLEMGLPSRN